MSPHNYSAITAAISQRVKATRAALIERQALALGMVHHTHSAKGLRLRAWRVRVCCTWTRDLVFKSVLNLHKYMHQEASASTCQHKKQGSSSRLSQFD
jgi:hypothetical protein